jgi:hypothetical protein
LVIGSDTLGQGIAAHPGDGVLDSQATQDTNSWGSDVGL